MSKPCWQSCPEPQVRLGQQQGKHAAARALLVEVYGWCSEGFETVDLQEAPALRTALA